MQQFERVVLLTTILFGLLSDGILGKGDIQFRILGSEFDKVASVFLKSRNDYRFNVSHSKAQGVTTDFLYGLTILQEMSNISVNHVHIPADGRMLLSTFSDVLKQTGNLKLSRLSNVDNVIYDGPIDVTLLNVTITSLVSIDYSNQIKTSNILIPLRYSNCSTDIEDISVNGKIMQNIGIEVSKATLKDIFKMSICESFNGHYSFAFEESKVSFRVFENPITVGTEAPYVEFKNDYVVITQKMKTVTKDGNLPYPAYDPTVSFPLPDSSSRPFEIILHTNVLNDLFEEFKKEIGIGVRDLPIGKLLPNLNKYSELDTQGLYMSVVFPMVGKKFPDAVATIIISDADIYFTIKDGSLDIHFDINATLSVSLNCDRNRTFNALKFSMNVVFPAQIGFDNQYITLNLLTFGGNFTILDSNVGHIIDRGLATLLYSAPYFLSGSMHKLNGMFRGIPLQDILPKTVFAEVDLITIKGSNLIIGGNLSLTDPKLPRIKREKIKWAGNKPKKELFLVGIDNTPENPEGFQLKEENCKKQVHSSANQLQQTVILSLMNIITTANQLTGLF